MSDMDLYNAARSGDLETLRRIANRSNVNTNDWDGLTPLYMAALGGHVETCRYLISVGAEVNKTDKRGCTPLHIAAGSRHVETCQCLVENGADINKFDNNGRTPPQHTVNEEVIAYLKSVEDERRELAFVFKRAHIEDDDYDDYDEEEGDK